MVVPNDTELPYTFKLSEVTAEQKQGGSVKIVDSKTFKISTARVNRARARKLQQRT